MDTSVFRLAIFRGVLYGGCAAHGLQAEIGVIKQGNYGAV
jgi:hypothetical protein